MNGVKLPALLAGVLLIGLGDAIAQPYLVLYGADRVGLSPLEVGVLLSVSAISGITIASLLGRRYDRSPSRWPAFVAALAPAAGYALLSTTTSYAVLLLLSVTVLAAAGAGFPQLFALARDHLRGSSRGTPALRAMWSLAWATGPLIGAALLTTHGYRGVFLATAAAFLAVVVPLVLLGRTPRTADRADRARGRIRVGYAAVAFTLFHTSMYAGSVVLPLFVTRSLYRPDSDVGLLFSVCAIAEIPASLLLMALPRRIRPVRLILAGMGLMVAYFMLTAAATGMPMLIGAQVARGVAIAVTVALGITHFQEMMPAAPGRATTLFTNTAAVGGLVAGVLGGSAAQFLGYRWATVVCGGLAAAGLVAMIAARRQSSTASSTSSAAPAVQP